MLQTHAFLCDAGHFPLKNGGIYPIIPRANAPAYPSCAFCTSTGLRRNGTFTALKSPRDSETFPITPGARAGCLRRQAKMKPIYYEPA